jgi:hypothetical protein
MLDCRQKRLAGIRVSAAGLIPISGTERRAKGDWGIADHAAVPVFTLLQCKFGGCRMVLGSAASSGSGSSGCDQTRLETLQTNGTPFGACCALSGNYMPSGDMPGRYLVVPKPGASALADHTPSGSKRRHGVDYSLRHRDSSSGESAKLYCVWLGTPVVGDGTVYCAA